MEADEVGALQATELVNQLTFDSVVNGDQSVERLIDLVQSQDMTPEEYEDFLIESFLRHSKEIYAN
jgi:hypothetical protein